MKHKVKFTFPPKLVQEPIIYKLGVDFHVVTNIRRADVDDTQGWVIMELDGKESDIKRGLEWVRQKGVRVDPISGDVVEG